jgi:hypothetical protein
VSAPAPRGRRASTVIAGAVLLVVAVVFACTKVPTDPTAVFSLSVDSIPSPSVVAGDTLRDTTGTARPLSGRAYNVQGQVLTAVRVQFIALTPDQLTIDSLNFAMGATLGDSVSRVVASAHGLQSLPFILPVVLRPDSILHADTDSVTTVHLTTTALDSNTSPTLGILLRHVPASVGGDSVTRSYLIHYQITYPSSATGATGMPSDTTLFAYLIDANGNPSRRDTTDLNGGGTRRVHFQVGRIAPGSKDSVVVSVSSFYRKTAVAGSPLRFVVHYIAP